jgi:hypothetical protein
MSYSADVLAAPTLQLQYPGGEANEVEATQRDPSPYTGGMSECVTSARGTAGGGAESAASLVHENADFDDESELVPSMNDVNSSYWRHSGFIVGVSYKDGQPYPTLDENVVFCHSPSISMPAKNEEVESRYHAEHQLEADVSARDLQVKLGSLEFHRKLARHIYKSRLGLEKMHPTMELIFKRTRLKCGVLLERTTDNGNNSMSAKWEASNDYCLCLRIRNDK